MDINSISIFSDHENLALNPTVLSISKAHENSAKDSSGKIIWPYLVRVHAPFSIGSVLIHLSSKAELVNFRNTIDKFLEDL